MRQKIDREIKRDRERENIPRRGKATNIKHARQIVLLDRDRKIRKGKRNDY